LRCRSADQRQAGCHTGIAHRQPGGEIVGAVDDEGMALKQAQTILRPKGALDRSHGHERVQSPNELRRQACLGLAGIAAAVDGWR
jgi:hypothetical protein